MAYSAILESPLGQEESTMYKRGKSMQLMHRGAWILRTKLINKFKEKLKSKLDITRGKKCNFIKKKKQ